MKTRLSLAGSLAALAVSLPVLCQAQSGSGPAPVVLSSPIAKYAEFDSPPPFVQALGQNGMAKLAARLESMGSIVEQTVRTRVADLSF